MSVFEHATFGNRGGSHQLLETSLPADDPVLEDLRFLVDRPVGHIGSEVVWSPYWGCGPIRNWWGVWRGEEDVDAPRKNMVNARVALLHFHQCDTLEHLDAALKFLSDSSIIQEDITVSALINALAHSDSPVVFSGISSVPTLLRKLWPHLWPNACKTLSIRTMFGSETLESSSEPDIIIIPKELRPRWNSHIVIENEMQSQNPAALLFEGRRAPELESLLQANFDRLPGELSVLGRLERIVEKIKVIQSGEGRPTDALIMVRTLEGLDAGVELPGEDKNVVTQQLLQLADMTVGDIRAASLTKLTILGESIQEVAGAVSSWIQGYLFDQSDNDALWILEQQNRAFHSSWWRTAVREGLKCGFSEFNNKWAKALWFWWNSNPQAVHWVKDLLPKSTSVEETLLENISEINDHLLEPLTTLCAERHWAKLLAGALCGLKPLSQAVDYLRSTLGNPEQGLDVLLKGRKSDEVVNAAANIIWGPLQDHAIVLTIKEPMLFSNVRNEDVGFRPLLSGHLEAGGIRPKINLDETFALSIFDGIVAGDEDAAQIAFHFADDLANNLITYPDQDAFWHAVTGEKLARLAEVAGNAWLCAFVLGQVDLRPNPALVKPVCSIVRSNLKGHEFERVLSFLIMFPEVSEIETADWLSQDDFRWKEGDTDLLGDMLLERDWKNAAKKFQRSPKSELRAAARHAQVLIPAFDLFSWLMPSTSEWDIIPKLPISNGALSAMSRSKTKEVKLPIIGIITIKEEEYRAILDKFSPSETKRGDNRDYDLVTINTPRGDCLVAITRCLHQGNVHAQNAATELLSDLNPDFILVVGIAGGIPTADFGLGDVVVSNYIHDLTLEDTGASTELSRFNAQGGPLHPAVGRIVERLPALERNDSRWSDLATIGVPRPELDGKYTSEDEAWNKMIDEAFTSHAERTFPLATAKQIASSDRLVKDPELLGIWGTVLKGVSAIEMESAGVYIPCQRNSVPVLAIRGISDIVGWKRDEAWTLYACHTAAAYTRMLIESGLFCADTTLDDHEK